MIFALTTTLVLLAACPNEPGPTEPSPKVEAASAELIPSVIQQWLTVKGQAVSTGFSTPSTGLVDRGCHLEREPKTRVSGKKLKNRVASKNTSKERKQERRPALSVNAPSHAVVIELGPKVITLESVAFRNHRRHQVQVQLLGDFQPISGRPLQLGAQVSRGDKIAVAVGSLEVRVSVDGQQLAPAALFARWSELFDPTAETRLVVVHQGSREMLFRDGKEVQRFRVGFGQAPGAKTRRGDNRSPRGMYFIVQHHRGTFGGPYGEYYGGHWIKLNYPNRFDAERGLSTGLIDKRTARKISAAWLARKLTYQGSKLGSGIGFHGWVSEWSNDDPWLSWGCLVMHNPDIKALYDQLPIGTMVILL